MTHHQHHSPAQQHSARGFTMMEGAAVVAVAAVAASVAVPLFQRVGCSASRAESAAKLATLSAAHGMYAADWSDRQLTLCPDDLGAYQGDWSMYQASQGCAPSALLGQDARGLEHSLSVACGGSTGGGEHWLKPFSFKEPSLVGAFRLGNVRALNEYVGGRFLDSAFYAPDDRAITRRAWRNIDAGVDFDPATFALTTYTMSPAAMFDPRVFGDGSSLTNPTFTNPNGDGAPSLGGEGYRSPSISLCQYPSHKTQLMEMWCMEGAPNITNPNMPGPTPYLATHTMFGRALASYFDGSVRIITTRETQQAESRSGHKLWNRNVFGFHGYFGAQSYDWMSVCSPHFLTSSGIRGRDVVETP